MVKLIITDLDDTLLHSDKSISDYTVEVFKKCRKEGILYGFCTARGEMNITQYIDRLKPDIIITSGGAMSKYHGESVFSCLMTEEETKRLIEAGLKVTDGIGGVAVDTMTTHYRNQRIEDEEETAEWGSLEYTDYSDFNEKSLKVCVETTDKAKAAQVAACIEDCDYIKFSDCDWYKFSKRGATKENAIVKTAEYLGINIDEIIAFGDDYGDIGMLTMCGRGVAVENAIEPVKAIADHIAKSNDEDGVADYIDNKVLI